MNIIAAVFSGFYLVAANGNEWKTWTGNYGITYHEKSYDVDNFCPVKSTTKIGNACWRLDKEGNPFKTDVLSKFCARRNTISISFGHPTAVECGKCTEIRVKRTDGSYNKVTVMTVDNPGSGGTTSSPELSTEGKRKLTEGTGKHILDRLPFEWRLVPCVSDGTSEGGGPDSACSSEDGGVCDGTSPSEDGGSKTPSANDGTSPSEDGGSKTPSANDGTSPSEDGGSKTPSANDGTSPSEDGGSKTPSASDGTSPSEDGGSTDPGLSNKPFSTWVSAIAILVMLRLT